MIYVECPSCGGKLCYMDRRDWDECVWCSAPLPEELKVPDE